MLIVFVMKTNENKVFCGGSHDWCFMSTRELMFRSLPKAKRRARALSLLACRRRWRRGALGQRSPHRKNSNSKGKSNDSANKKTPPFVSPNSFSGRTGEGKGGVDVKNGYRSVYWMFECPECSPAARRGKKSPASVLWFIVLRSCVYHSSVVGLLCC